MNIIKSFLQSLNPRIILNYIKTEETVNNVKIGHKFVCFDAKNIEIKSTISAKILAKRMGQKVFPFLDRLIKYTKNKDKRNILLRTKNWVDKKAVWHPAMVEASTVKVLKIMKHNSKLNDLGLSYKQIRTDTAIAAILHDIGRLSEIDIEQGIVIQKSSAINKSHAAISFDILKNADIKPEILLSVRYHEFADIKELQADKLFQNLTVERKKIAEFYTKLLQDMDKTANLIERSINGTRKSSEYFNSDYAKDYTITDEYLKIAISGAYLPVKIGHLLDVMVHYVTWGYDVHYKETEKLLTPVLSDIFLRMYEEAWDEYNNSDYKNSQLMANTLEKITQLEDYVISERMGMDINKKNRRKIKEQIKKLHGN